MNQELKLEILNRAKAIFPIIRDQLNRDYEVDLKIASALKYCYLVIYGPNRFLEQFKEGDMLLFETHIDEVFNTFRDMIPGNPGLMNEEREMIYYHNAEVRDYLSMRGNVLAYRTNKIGLSGDMSQNRSFLN